MQTTQALIETLANDRNIGKIFLALNLTIICIKDFICRNPIFLVPFLNKT